MTDCPNGDVRDLLPDLLHDRLDEESRRTVDAHLSSCADCRAELALLTDMRAMMNAHPVSDVGGIVAALPAAAPLRNTTRGTRMLGWRTAAAITILAAGGTSVALVQRNAEPIMQGDSVALVARAPARGESIAVAGPFAAPSIAPLGGPASAAATATTPTTDAPRATASSSFQIPSAARPRELAMAGSTVGDLTDRELAALLSQIDALDGAPSQDVESVDLAPLPPRAVRP